MKYKNKRTGRIITISSYLSGDNWEKVMEKPEPKTPAKKPVKKTEKRA
jgi:hypothetical protein